MSVRGSAWIPAAVFGVGCLLNLSVATQRSMPLADSLTTIPKTIEGYEGTDQTIAPDEVRIAGTTRSLLRVYARDSADFFSVYVGYYNQQRQGRTIHSPKNCLPGGGWEPVESAAEVLPTSVGPVRTNRWIIQKKNLRSLVMYWYQGRGRTESNEYQVKLDLMRDAAFRRRSEEALVRVVVPIVTTPEAAAEIARKVVADLAPSLKRILPT